MRWSRVELELKVCPRSPMMPRRWGKASGDIAGALMKLISGLKDPAGSPHLQSKNCICLRWPWVSRCCGFSEVLLVKLIPGLKNPAGSSHLQSQKKKKVLI